MSPATVSPDATSDDKLWAALGYPIVLIAIIMLLMEEKKVRSFIKYHAVQAIAANVVLFVLGIVVSIVTFGFGGICVPLLWLVFLYWAYLAYQGQLFEIPVVTKFIQNQGWI
ncbi:MAG TPA: hypothetical protein VLL49_06785 [Anaerolineales bacterium]|nr:hypothetical protein [Anaerolineales bacterium]